MPMNGVQFQKGLSMPEFLDRYGTEERCEQALVAARWPSGFVCPACGVMSSRTTFRRQGRPYRPCAGCQHQCSVTSGTVFESTKLPLTRWFLAMQLLTQSKNNVSALELKRQIGAPPGSSSTNLAASLGACHDRTVTGGGKVGVELEPFRCVNTLISNIKTALSGTYHSVRLAKYAHRYLAEVKFRFNRRYNLHAILGSLLSAMVAAPPSPGRGIRAAEHGC